MDGKWIWITLGVAVLIIGAAIYLLPSISENEEHRSGTYGMDLTVKTENVTNVDSNFKIVVTGDKGRITYAEKQIHIDAHGKKSVKIPIDWDGSYGFYAEVKVTRSGGAFIKEGLMLHSGEDQTITLIPKG